METKAWFPQIRGVLSRRFSPEYNPKRKQFLLVFSLATAGLVGCSPSELLRGEPIKPQDDGDVQGSSDTSPLNEAQTLEHANSSPYQNLSDLPKNENGFLYEPYPLTTDGPEVFVTLTTADGNRETLRLHIASEEALLNDEQMDDNYYRDIEPDLQQLPRVSVRYVVTKVLDTMVYIQIEPDHSNARVQENPGVRSTFYRITQEGAQLVSEDHQNTPGFYISYLDIQDKVGGAWFALGIPLTGYTERTWIADSALITYHGEPQ